MMTTNLTETSRFAAAELAALIESTHDLIWAVNLEYRLVTFNKAYADHIHKNFGHTAAVGKRPQDLLDLATAANWPPMYERALAEGSFRCEYELPDGRWLKLNINPIQGDGKAIGFSVFGEDITQRKQAFEALQEREDLLAVTGETAKIGGWELNPETGKLVWTRETMRIHEVDDDFSPTVETAIGFYSPESRPIIEQAVSRAISQSVPFDVVLAIETARGNRRDVRAIGKIRVRRDGGRALFGTFQDITDYKRAEDALRASEARLREAEIVGQFGSSTWEIASDTIQWSEGLYHITGRTPGNAPKNHADRANLYSAESWTRLDAAVQRTLATGESYDLELQIVRPDGTLRWTRARGEAMCNGAGKIVSLFGTLQDIESKKQLEADIQASEERYRATFTQAPVGIVHTARDGRMLRCNPWFADFLGYTQEEIVGMSILEVTSPEDRAKSKKYLDEVWDGNSVIGNFEKRYRRKDGGSVWGWVSFSIQKDHAGDPVHSITVVEDITARKTAEESLAKVEQKFRQIYEDAPEGIYQISPEGNSISMNPASAKMLGYKSVEEGIASIRNAAQTVWVHPEERARYIEILDREGEIREFVSQFKCADGSVKWLALTARRIANESGQAAYYQGFMQDITERKQLEETLRAKVRELQLLSEINAVLLKAESEQELLQEYCRIVVEVGGYRMAWVGFAENDAEKHITPVAHYGHEDGYLKIVNLTWEDSERGRGPTGGSIRTGKVQCITEFTTDPRTRPWWEEAGKRGYRASIALPLHYSETQMASLTAYSGAPIEWTESEQHLMQQIAEDLGYGIKTFRTENDKIAYQRELRTSLLQTIQVISETVDQRDPYTSGHQRRVADLSSQIGKSLGLSEERVLGLTLAATIHDVGKIAIPIELLTKPGRLTPAQFEVIKEHAQLGYEIVKNVHFPWPIADIVHQHHERLDGSGYPLHLKADHILLESKILAVADVVEAMGTDRPYRASRGIEAALAELLARRGVLFDPEVVDACVALFRDEGYNFPA